MKQRIINWLIWHPLILRISYNMARGLINCIGLFVPIRNKVIFASFGGKGFNDSPYVLFKRMKEKNAFSDYEFVWAFNEPEKYHIPGAKTVKIDTAKYFYELLSSKIWISNTSIDRGIGIKRGKHISIETWHGCPLKKICGEENSGRVLNENLLRKKDRETIRCAQSEYDRTIFERVFNAEKETILLSDLPRNDELCRYTENEISSIKNRLNIPSNKKVLLYMPTYREYWIDKKMDIYMKSLIDVDKWENKLGNDFILLIRLHYAVSKALSYTDNDFCRDVSLYSNVNDLYKVADILISDYSSGFIDFSITRKPMLCYANDISEYSEKRGFYLDLKEVLPCDVYDDEDNLVDNILHLDYKAASEKTNIFRQKFAPYAGNATERVIFELETRIL